MPEPIFSKQMPHTLSYLTNIMFFSYTQRNNTEQILETGGMLYKVSAVREIIRINNQRGQSSASGSSGSSLYFHFIVFKDLKT